MNNIRYILLVIDLLIIIPIIILSIDVVIFIKKSEGKKVDLVSKYLNPRIKILKILSIILTIIGIVTVIINATN